MGDEGHGGRKFNAGDWVGIVVCVLIGMSVAKVVATRVDPVMDFWPAFAIGQKNAAAYKFCVSWKKELVPGVAAPAAA